jgi:hypothetical protein
MQQALGNTKTLPTVSSNQHIRLRHLHCFASFILVLYQTMEEKYWALDGHILQMGNLNHNVCFMCFIEIQIYPNSQICA